LLVAACDEFIYYDDLVREQKPRKPAAQSKPAAKPAPGTPAPAVPKTPVVKQDADKQQEAIDLVLDTVDALVEERGEDDTIWGSMVKQALKRRKPGFNESYYGFRSFNDLLEEAYARRLLELERDKRSGGYIVRLPEE
jgi:hypothetical protein